MQDRFLLYIAEKRAKIAKQRAKLDVVEAALDQSEKHYLASGAAKNKSEQIPPTKRLPQVGNGSTLQSIAENIGSLAGTISYAIPLNATIKERVVAILKQHPTGMTSGQLLNTLKATGLPQLHRESLSPQLTRLKKNDALLDSENGLWRLKENRGEDDLSDIL